MVGYFQGNGQVYCWNNSYEQGKCIVSGDIFKCEDKYQLDGYISLKGQKL